MGPFTIDHRLIACLAHHARAEEADEMLLSHVQAECPDASLREIARAALYLATDPDPAAPVMTGRFYSFSVKLRRMV